MTVSIMSYSRVLKLALFRYRFVHDVDRVLWKQNVLSKAVTERQKCKQTELHDCAQPGNAPFSLPVRLGQHVRSVFLQLPDVFLVWFVGLLSLAWFTELEILRLSWVWLDARLFTFFVVAWFLLFFQASWFVLAEMSERVGSRQLGDFSLKGS